MAIDRAPFSTPTARARGARAGCSGHQPQRQQRLATQEPGAGLRCGGQNVGTTLLLRPPPDAAVRPTRPPVSSPMVAAKRLEAEGMGEE